MSNYKMTCVAASDNVHFSVQSEMAHSSSLFVHGSRNFDNSITDSVFSKFTAFTNDRPAESDLLWVAGILLWWLKDENFDIFTWFWIVCAITGFITAWTTIIALAITWTFGILTFNEVATTTRNANWILIASNDTIRLISSTCTIAGCRASIGIAFRVDCKLICLWRIFAYFLKGDSSQNTVLRSRFLSRRWGTDLEFEFWKIFLRHCKHRLPK